MKKYEWVDHTADEGFRAYGEDLPEAFENAALAFFDIITDVDKISSEDKIEIELEAEDKEALLFDWLDKFLYLHDVEKMVFSEFNIKFIKEKDGKVVLCGEAKGEKFDSARHGLGIEVKAITYHMMEIVENEECYVQVVVDI